MLALIQPRFYRLEVMLRAPDGLPVRDATLHGSRAARIERYGRRCFLLEHALLNPSQCRLILVNRYFHVMFNPIRAKWVMAAKF